MRKSACFTGHREISENAVKLFNRLYRCLEKLITEENVTDFYAGGAVGFDTIAAKCVLSLREKYKDIHLHLVLPCPNEEQTKGWSANEKYEFRAILSRADSVEYTSEHRTRECMRIRNAKLAEHANSFCVCYYDTSVKSGTGQTVGFAKKKGLEVINLFGQNH